MDIAMQAIIVVMLEERFGVKKCNAPAGPMAGTLDLAVKKFHAKLKYWDDEEAPGRIVVNYGDYWISGTTDQIREAWMYTANMDRLVQEAKDKKSKIKIVRG